jgi:hypothetical protein
MAAAHELFMGYGKFLYSKNSCPLLNFWFTF